MQPSFNPYAPPQAIGSRRRREPADELEPAGLGRRLFAALIDLSPQLLILALVFYAGVTEAERPRDESLHLALGLLIFAAVPYQLYQWYLVSISGQSLGKRWLGLQIVRSDGLPAGFVHGVLLRSWLLALAVLIPVAGPLLWCFVDPLMLFGSRRRCLHDYISGTRVVVASSE